MKRVVAQEAEPVKTMTISPKECAKLLGVSRTTMYNLLNLADFPAFKVSRNPGESGGAWHINVARLQDWLDTASDMKEVVI